MTKANARKGTTGVVHRVTFIYGTAWAACNGRQPLRGYQQTTDTVTCKTCAKYA